MTTPVDSIPVMRPTLGAEEAQAAADAVTSGWVAQGPRVAAFEEAVAARTGARYGVAASSCTTALHLALVLLRIGPGDEVVVPSLSFIATANAVRYTGATPVFADVDAATLNMTPATIDCVRSPRTRAVVLVHQAGIPADVAAVHDFCDPLGIAIVEDAACAIGSEFQRRPIGSHSDLVALSFHPRKVITTGEGGMLLTLREDFATRARRLREHAMSLSAAARHAGGGAVIEEYVETGFNYRMTDIQAAVGLVQLRRLDDIVSRRRLLAARYREVLADEWGLATAVDPPYGRSNFQSFWVLLPDAGRTTRNEVLRIMAARGVQARRGIMAAHLEPAYLGRSDASLPVTEYITSRSLILPLFHDMTDSDQARVVAVFREAMDLEAR